MSGCSCKSNSANNKMNKNDQTNGKVNLFSKIIIFFYSSIFLFINLGELSNGFTYSILKLDPSSKIGEAVAFFIFETAKVIILLVLVVFIFGVIRTFFTAERIRKILAGRKEFVGNILASLLGIITPFCSCSAIPFFIGFITAGVPLGITFSFLISAPMINEVALVLLFGLFGWKISLIYLLTGLCIAIFSGLIIGKLHLEKDVEQWVYEANTQDTNDIDHSLTWEERINLGFSNIIEIVSRVWPYLIIGIAIGSFIHGYVPENYMASIIGKSAIWSVPVAVLVGVPLYSNAVAIIPIVQSLLEKGAALGTVLAFMMSVIALSLPEIIILRRVLKPRLIIIFVGIVAFGILIVGYLFNLIF
ncbi:MAG: permease [bacterium]